MHTRRDGMETAKIGNKEYQLKKIKGEPALDLLSLGGKPESIKEILKMTIEHGSNAKLEDLTTKDIIQLVDKVNEFNGFTEDFTKALEEKSGK